ncbi:MAG: carbonate dehydratase [Gammaproteobacteria bacterium 39-13]|nr:carbonic anhydrase [Gammaproteobacteria bacterium]OJV87784.1 MAG: carbonate dehydratase [Gammaproteobacteria bacterium 39-13]
MENTFKKIIQGYQAFRQKYALGDDAVMHYLAHHGQQPEIMVVACCDSRVDPALIMQCDPGDLFVVRNVANIIPPFEKDEAHHGTSAALEFGIQGLKVQHLIILGHSQCGGIHALLNQEDLSENDFINNWVSLIETNKHAHKNVDEFAKKALLDSYHNCMTFPWIKQKVESKELNIHLWFFNIKEGEIFTYSQTQKKYVRLDENSI